MGQQTRARVDRRRREVASSYRKQGYHVTIPSATGTLPPFLRDCHPDIIAEKEGDKVVIEIKPSTGLKGSNDLVDLAGRVAEEHGWRLELVTVHDEPDYSDVLDPGWLEAMLREGAPLDRVTMECFQRTYILRQLIRGLAATNKIKTRDKATLHIARELAYEGALGQDLLDRVVEAIAWIDSVLGRTPLARSPRLQSQEIETLCRDILRHAQNPED